MSAAFAALPHGRVLQYHNVTPARFFAPYAPSLFRLASIAREELAGLAPAVGPGARRLRVQPPGARGAGVLQHGDHADRGRIPSGSRRRRAHPVLEEILDDGLVNFLFVGRIAPNKKIEDHIRLAEQYKRYVDAYYRFIFVGRYDVVPQYYATIRALLSEYQMLEDRFIFTGPVPDVELAAYYRAVERLRLAERARGFLRAAGRGDGDGRARACVQRRRRSRHAWRCRACSLRRRISNTPPNCWACSRSRKVRARKCWRDSGGGFRISGITMIQQRLASVISGF